jgi:hypothetical protein
VLRISKIVPKDDQLNSWMVLAGGMAGESPDFFNKT